MQHKHFNEREFMDTVCVGDRVKVVKASGLDGYANQDDIGHITALEPANLVVRIRWENPGKLCLPGNDAGTRFSAWWFTEWLALVVGPGAWDDCLELV